MPKFGTLGAAAAYCQDHGCPVDDIKASGKGFAVDKGAKLRAKVLRSKPAKKKKKRGKETRAEREARLDDYDTLRGDIASSRERERDAKGARTDKLGTVRQDCEARRKSTTSDCKARRQRAREIARSILRQERELRDLARESYAARRELTPKERAASPLRYLQGESDDFAEYGMTEAQLHAWRGMRQEFPYELAPDLRAEAFGEVYEAERGAYDAAFWEEQEEALTDEALARAEAESPGFELPF